MTYQEAQPRLAAADRYPTMAAYTDDQGMRSALIGAARESEQAAPKPGSTAMRRFDAGITFRSAFSPANGDGAELAYLDRRYEQEMQLAGDASSKAARIAHLELAYRYAVRARDLRAASISEDLDLLSGPLLASAKSPTNMPARTAFPDLRLPGRLGDRRRLERNDKAADQQ